MPVYQPLSSKDVKLSTARFGNVTWYMFRILKVAIMQYHSPARQFDAVMMWLYGAMPLRLALLLYNIEKWVGVSA